MHATYRLPGNVLAQLENWCHGSTGTLWTSNCCMISPKTIAIISKLRHFDFKWNG